MLQLAIKDRRAVFGVSFNSLILNIQFSRYEFEGRPLKTKQSFNVLTIVNSVGTKVPYP